MLQKSLGIAALPPGSRLLRVGQQSVKKLSELPVHPPDTRRLWLQTSSPHTGACVLSEAFQEVLRLWLDLCESGTAVRSLLRPPRLDCSAFADACASPTQAGVGGFVRLPDGRQLFFGRTFSGDELHQLFPWFPITASAQSYIATWELLAQCALVVLLDSLLGPGHLPVHCVFKCHNSAADAASWKGLSMAQGLCAHRISVYIDHVPGLTNDVADVLSRGSDPLSLGFEASQEFLVSWDSFQLRRKSLCFLPQPTFRAFFVWLAIAPLDSFFGCSRGCGQAFRSIPLWFYSRTDRTAELSASGSAFRCVESFCDRRLTEPDCRFLPTDKKCASLYRFCFPNRFGFRQRTVRNERYRA